MAKTVDVVNLTGADMNAMGGSANSVPAWSRKDNLTFLDAEIGIVIDTLKVCIIKSTANEVEHRYGAKLMKRTPPYSALAPGLKDQGT